MSLTGCVYKTLYWFAGLFLICAGSAWLIAHDITRYDDQLSFLTAGMLIGFWSATVLTGHAIPKLSWLRRSERVPDRRTEPVWADRASEIIDQPLPLRWAPEASVDHALSDFRIAQQRISCHPAAEESGSISERAR